MKRTLALLLCAFACVAFARAQVLDRAIPLDGARALRLNVSGPLHLIAAPGTSAIAFHVVDSGPSSPPMMVRASRAGSRIDVSITGPSESVLPFTGASGYGLVVRYPPQLALDVREFAGNVHVDRVTAPMQLYDADGSIAVDAAPQSLTAQADAGNIVVAHAANRLMLSTIDGNVDARLARRYEGRLIRLESQHGNLHLAVGPGFRGRYDLTSSQGRVTNSERSTKGGALVFMLTERGTIAVDSL
jgi:hypothetical protein